MPDRIIRLCAFSICIGLSCVATAQDVDSIKKVNTGRWQKGVQISLYGGQAGSKNWASGSNLFSVSVNSFVYAHANYTKGKWVLNNSLSASYGLMNSDEYATIKNDDKIDLFSTFGRQWEKRKQFSWSAAFNFRSQFSNGYERDYLNQGLKRRTSGFFAPAYITVAPVGINYREKGLDIYASPAGFRGVLVSNDAYSYLFQGGIIPDELVNYKNPSKAETSVAALYGVDPEKTISYQFGPYVSVAFKKILFKNVSYNGRFDIFSDFNHDAPENIDFFWQNSFTFHVNAWLNALYSLDLAYDDDIKKFGAYHNSPGLQVKSILGLGVTAKFGDKSVTNQTSKRGHH